jgi:hypothetical protein
VGHKKNHENMCQDLHKSLNETQKSFQKIIIGVGMWVYWYNPGTTDITMTEVKPWKCTDQVSNSELK